MIVFPIDPFQKFFQRETSGGIFLFLAALLALVWANSSWQETYFSLWRTSLSVGFAPFSLVMPVHDWINDGLMTLFFFLIGLEIKRELVGGELSSVRQALFPILAAIGGMALPAVFYILVNPPETPFNSGWGIPTVTDIAFSLGVLALLGKRIPWFLKVFLTTLAIADDMGAIIIIALFYAKNPNLTHLGQAGLLLALLFLLNQFRVLRLFPYILLGFLLWLTLLHSGVHATLAGVLLALSIPIHAQPEASREIASLQRLEQGLHPWVTYGVMPLFALANAGVQFDAADIATTLMHPVAYGIILGLFLGKQLGIFLGSWLAIRFKLIELPTGITLRHLYGIACLGGIGFTMSLFIASLAFQDTVLDIAKIGIFIASSLSGAMGWMLLRTSRSTENRSTV